MFHPLRKFLIWNKQFTKKFTFPGNFKTINFWNLINTHRKQLIANYYHTNKEDSNWVPNSEILQDNEYYIIWRVRWEVFLICYIC